LTGLPFLVCLVAGVNPIGLVVKLLLLFVSVKEKSLILKFQGITCEIVAIYAIIKDMKNFVIKAGRITMILL
jgi:hypothetical protein